MSSITYRCPDCGSSLKYDPQMEKWVCLHCQGCFDQQQMQRLEDASEEHDGVVVYACPGCGGEIVTSETTVADFCYYCHSPVVLKGRLSGDWKPNGVIPFSITRGQAQQAFINWARKRWFTPGGFSAKEHIEKITGVYYPYWITNAEFDAQLNGQIRKAFVRKTQSTIIDTVRYFSITKRAKMAFKNIMRSGLAKRSDILADGVQPYWFDAIEPFSESYLAGFQAERWDVRYEEITASVQDEMKQYAHDILLPTKDEGEVVASAIYAYNMKMKPRFVLLPAWVVTYKAPKGKLYHYVVNGQTAKTCGILPVDKCKLYAVCICVFAAITTLGCLGGRLVW